MPNSVEILLHAVDQASGTIKNVKMEVVGLGDAVKDVVAPPAFNLEPLDDLRRKLKELMADAEDSQKKIREGADEVGLSMQGLQAIIEATFTPAAIVAFIPLLLSLPQIFRDLEDAVTGWDAKAQEAWREQTRLAQEHRGIIQEIQHLQREQAGEKGAALVRGDIADREQDLKIAKERIDAHKKEIALQQKLRVGPYGGIGTSIVAALAPGAKSVSKLTEDLKDAQAAAVAAQSAIDRLSSIGLLQAESNEIRDQTALWFKNAEERIKAE